MPRGIYRNNEERKRKIRKAMSGENNPMYGVHKFGKDASMFGKHHTEATKEKMRKAKEGKYPTKEQIRKCLCRRTPSSLEDRFQTIIDKHNLPYKYTGNGSFIIGHYNPDFININGEKIAIEVYADYYKLKKYKDINKWKEERAKVFGEFGWEVVYFNEAQVNEDYVLNYLAKGG